MKAAPSDKPLLGLFHTGTMNVYIDREMLKNPKVLKGFDDQPNLMDMTKKSLDILSKNPNGFFAMIEGASIDKQLHVMDWQRAAYDTIEFDKSIEYAENGRRNMGTIPSSSFLQTTPTGFPSAAPTMKGTAGRARKLSVFTPTPFSPPSRTLTMTDSPIIRIPM